MGSACGGSDDIAAEVFDRAFVSPPESPELTLVEVDYLADRLAALPPTFELWGGPRVSSSQVGCFMEKLIAGRGIAGFERLNDSMASAAGQGGASRLDATYFFRAVGSCIDLLKAQKEAAAQAENVGIDAIECAFEGVSKSDVEGWFVDYFVEGGFAFQDQLFDRVSNRIPGCVRDLISG
jgi:hypothetical protein